jgi:hypothetical protein
MSKKNITVQIDEALLKTSRHIAIEEDKSLSEWVGSLIVAAVRRKTNRESSRRRALTVLKNPLHLGGKTFSRNELHER